MNDMCDVQMNESNYDFASSVTSTSKDIGDTDSNHMLMPIYDRTTTQHTQLHDGRKHHICINHNTTSHVQMQTYLSDCLEAASAIRCHLAMRLEPCSLSPLVALPTPFHPANTNCIMNR